MSSSRCVAETVPFRDLCLLLDRLCASRGRKAEVRRMYLGKFIESWRVAHNKLHADHKATPDDSFFAAMRLILPSFDKDRGAYGFKENMLAKRFIHIFCLAKDNADALGMLNYRAPTTKSHEAGDFAATVSAALRVRLAAKCSLTIHKLNEHLDAIAVANANKEKAAVEHELEMLCRSVTENEMKWLIRILLKQMKIGMQETSVLSVFHAEAAQLYDVSTSLRRVCEQLHEPTTRLDAIQLQLGCPFRPMLANRAPPERVCHVMAARRFFVETKYDGERVQLHKDGDAYKYFSRNGTDFTASYGASPSVGGSLTPFIHQLFAADVRSCILDAEMVGWNPQAECIATKGDQFDVRALRDGDDLNPCLVVFDCLLLNGRVLTTEPLTERLACLETVFARQDRGRFMLAKRELAETTDDVVKCLNAAIELREEGIIVKRPDSTYRLNTRSNEGGWLKIKPDYVDAISDDFDLLIVGGYWGEGARRNLMSHFLLALADKSGSETTFVTVGKVGSGYSHKELYDLNVHLNRSPLVRASDLGRPPPWLRVGYEKPDVYIEPHNSKILQVRAAEILTSSSYGVGYTLRFPRVQKIRADKTPDDCMTAAEFEQLRKDCAGKLAQQRLQLDAADGDAPAAKKRRGGRTAVRAELPAEQRGPATAPTRTSDVLAAKELCVMAVEAGKHAVETLVLSMGGRITQNAGAETFCVVADKKLMRVNNLIKTSRWNVARSDWLLRCRDEQRLVPWQPKDMVFALPEVELAFAADFDEWGDSYTDDVTLEQLRQTIGGVKVEPRPPDELSQLFNQLLPDYKYGLFRGCSAYVDRFVQVGDSSSALAASPLQLTAARFGLFGGRVVERPDEATHVLLHADHLRRLRHFEQLNAARAVKLHLVVDRWVADSIQRESLVEERAYYPL